MHSSEGSALFDALVTSYEFVQIDKTVLQKFKWSAIVSKFFYVFGFSIAQVSPINL